MPDPLEPSLGQRAAYYLLDMRVPAAHKEWVKRDITSPWWPWRTGLRDVLAILIGAAVAAFFTDRWEALFGVLIAAPIILLIRYFGRRKGRETAFKRHGLN